MLGDNVIGNTGNVADEVDVDVKLGLGDVFVGRSCGAINGWVLAEEHPAKQGISANRIKIPNLISYFATRIPILVIV